MRAILLFGLLSLFAGTNQATAQYTSRSSNSSYTSSKTTKPQPAAMKPAATTNSYTTRQTAPKTVSVTPTAVTFRPRSADAAQTTTGSQATQDDDIPSFDAFNNKSAGSVQVAKPVENLPPPVPPKGEIWIYITDFENTDLNGKFKQCYWKLVVQNRSDTVVKHMDLTYSILGSFSPIYVSDLAPKASQIEDRGMHSDKCPAMRGVRPTVTIKQCQFGPLVDAECAKYIKVR